jgi:thiosulfate reductase cytochrome b subunit
LKSEVVFYPVWLRAWHWLNAVLFLLMIISGISMHYSSNGSLLLSFKTSVFIHNICGITVSIIYLLFFIFNIFSKNIRYYFPRPKGIIKRLIKQSKYYLQGIFNKEPHPYEQTNEDKFNPLQQITYLFIMYGFMPVIIITGLLLIFPELAPDKAFGMGGIMPVAILHSSAAFFLTIFMAGHIYLATTGRTVLSNFKDMISGN